MVPDAHPRTRPAGSATNRAAQTTHAAPLVGVARAAWWTLLVAVVLSPGVVIAMQGAEGEGNLLRQAVYTLVFATALVVARLRTPQHPWPALPWSLGLALAWFALSLAWALDPAVAARRLLLTAMVIASVFLLVEQLGYAYVVSAMRRLLLAVLVLNFAAVLVLPHWAIHQAATEADPSIVGAWHGILVQKNFAGSVSALTVLFFLLDARRIAPWLRAGVVLGALLFLHQTNSRTSMLVLAASLGVATALRLYNPYYRWVVLVFLALLAAVGVLLATEYWANLAAPFSSGEGFTGRVQIWSALLHYAQEHWLLGAGFGSFWNIGHAQPIAHYAQGWVTDITSGHNGYLDMLVQAGVPGLALALLSMLLLPLARIFCNSTVPRARLALVLALVCFSAGHNLTESSLFERDAIVHVFVVLAIALLGTASREAAQERGPPR